MPDMRDFRGRAPGDDDAEQPGVAAAARLLRARNDWGATLLRSMLLLLAYGIVGIGILDALTGHATDVVSTVIAVITALQAALALVALVLVVVITVRLHGLDPDLRAQAASQVKTAANPRRASASRATRDWRLRVWIWSLLALLLLVMVDFLPEQVNAVAYLAGPGPTASFVGHSYHQECGRGGCYNVTEGTLLTHPAVSATWPDQAALGRPFTVRRPAWSGWGSPVQLMDGTWAGLLLGFGAFLDLISAGVLIALAYGLRNKLRSGRQDQSGLASDGKYPEWLLSRYAAHSKRRTLRR
jgi:hypothetical protein